MIEPVLSQLFQTLLAVLVAPLMLGWINNCRAWLQNKSAPGILQPYRTLRKLFHKDAVLAHNASSLFRNAPYLNFGCMVLAASIVPVVETNLPFAHAADAIALVGIFALARVFMALAAMDIGTAFGSLGARREMLVAFLAEPALLMVLFTPALISQSTSLNTMVETLAQTCMEVVREGYDKIVELGVPENAARDFVLGHLRIQIAVLFKEVNGSFSDAAYKISKRAKPILFKENWKRIFEMDDIKEQVKDITGKSLA